MDLTYTAARERKIGGWLVRIRREGGEVGNYFKREGGSESQVKERRMGVRTGDNEF